MKFWDGLVGGFFGIGERRTYSYFFPLVVVAFEEVGAVLDRHDNGAAGDDFWFRWEREVDAGCEGDDGRERGLACVFVVAEGAVVEDAVEFLEIRDGGVFEVEFGFLYASGELAGVFVEIVVVGLGCGESVDWLD